YTYGPLNNRPHALTQLTLSAGGKRTYAYDGNGNVTSEVQYDSANTVLAGKGRTATYTSFDMPRVLASPSATLSFTYGTDHQRIKQVSPAGTTIYVHPDNSGGLSYEKLTRPDGTIEHSYFIGADQLAAVVKQTGATTSVRYLHQDYLGSVTAVTNEAGAVLERFAYEPFGKRRHPNGSLDTSGALKGTNTNRGYTASEQLDDLGLIHMNGRVYDPVIGRFMSADPSVPHPEDPQSFNRYSYTRNNPLAFFDPTGFTDKPPTTIPITAPRLPSEPSPNWTYRTRYVEQEQTRDQGGDVLHVTHHVAREPAKSFESPEQSGLSWVSHVIASVQGSLERGLRAEPRWEAQDEVIEASMPGSISHGLHPLHGFQPYAATMANAMREVGKNWLVLITSLELAGPKRVISAVPTVTRFIDGVTITTPRGKFLMKGTVDLKPTLDRIRSKGTHPHLNDGGVFENKEGLLPPRREGYYREYVHPTPGVSAAGRQRVVTGQAGELYYTPDHYRTFIPLTP
ncbi:MAG TPA: ribonuclease domain-containing protein, partial [Myxococcus sp.]|nr:ribonuclease domain-containing protein [Myxococcus sp.]